MAAALAPGGTLWGLDRDPTALALTLRRLKAPLQPGTPIDDSLIGESRRTRAAGSADATPEPAWPVHVRAEGDVEVILQRSDFRGIGRLADEQAWPPLDGVLMDVGVSSMQLDAAERGFSFSHDGPLDMRMDPDASLTAEQVVNEWPEDRLTTAIRDWGEEKRARRIAAGITSARRRAPIKTTSRLADVVCDALGVRPGAAPRRGPRGRKKIHPATRTFQAIRIAVNDELGALTEGVTAAFERLAPGGRLVVISFHSLEDRIVKQFARDRAADGTGRILTRRPVRPGDAEVAANPRARSARLRAIERLAQEASR